MERRQQENTALRELVDALKNLVKARDDLWSLGIADRLFRQEKCREVFVRYDEAMRLVRKAILAVTKPDGKPSPEWEQLSEGLLTGGRYPPVSRGPLLSMEELEMLLRQPQMPPPRSRKKMAEAPSGRR